MFEKFNPSFDLSVFPAREQEDTSLNLSSANVRVRLPFTIDFNIVRQNFSSASNATIKIFNLNPETRELIRFDKIKYGVDKPVMLQAGYGENISVVFTGNIQQAFSIREGVNFITEIRAFDAGYAIINSVADVLPPFKKGTPYVQIIRSLIESMPGITVGGIGDFPGAISRDTSYSGSTIEVLDTLTNNSFFIDNLKGYALNKYDVIPTGDLIDVIDAEAGLIGTPRREQNYIYFDMLFEPKVTVGQRIFLRSATAESFNGFKKITSITHNCLISESVAGNRITTLGMLDIPGAFQEVQLG